MAVTNNPHSNSNPLIRYGFRIRSRNGITVEKLLIMGRDLDDARKKLGQMYPNCEILSTWQEIPGRPGTLLNNNVPKGTFEDIADLINHVL
jgi:hypothetical protein